MGNKANQNKNQKDKEFNIDNMGDGADKKLAQAKQEAKEESANRKAVNTYMIDNEMKLLVEASEKPLESFEDIIHAHALLIVKLTDRAADQEALATTTGVQDFELTFMRRVDTMTEVLLKECAIYEGLRERRDRPQKSVQKPKSQTRIKRIQTLKAQIALDKVEADKAAFSTDEPVKAGE